MTSGGNFLTALIIVRALGLDGFGQFSVGFLALLMVRNFYGGLVLSPLATIGPTLVPADLPAYRGFVALKALVFVSVSTLGLAGAFGAFGAFLDLPWVAAMIPAIIVANAGVLAAEYLRRMHFVFGRPGTAFTTDALRYTLQVFGLGFLTILGGEMLTPASALFLLAFAGLGGAAFGAVFHGPVASPSRVLSSVLPRHMKFVRWMAPNVVVEALQTGGVFLIAGGLLGETALGGLRAVQSLANVINLPLLALQQLAPSAAARNLAQGGLSSLLLHVRQLVAVLSGAALLLAVTAMLLSGKLIDLAFGPATVPFQFELLMFALANCVIAARYPFYIALQTVDRLNDLLVASSIAAVVSVVTVLAATPLLGTLAVPIASIAAASSAFFYVARRGADIFSATESLSARHMPAPVRGVSHIQVRADER